MDKVYWVVQYQGSKGTKWNRTIQISTLNEANQHCNKLNREYPDSHACVIRCEYNEYNEMPSFDEFDIVE